MKCTLISDLHGFYPKLPGGDLLIVAGDLTARDREEEYFKCFDWIAEQKYAKKIVIAGNHDNLMQREEYQGPVGEGEGEGAFTYLCDSGTEFEGLKIWGSPWTKTFPGMNPHCKAFTCDTENELSEKWALIPTDLDILITHSPAEGVLDEVQDRRSGRILNVGSSSLIRPLVKSGCRLHVCGHIHEAYGKFHNGINGITYVNASHVNEFYKPVNAPVEIEL